jgi:alanine dehydrogenase
MSEVAGRLAIQAGATALQKANGGRGVLLGGVPGVLPGKIAVLGGGVVGLQAAKMAAGLGADVSIIDRSIPRLRQLDDIFHGRVHTRYSTIEALEEEVFSADIVVGAVLIPGAAAPKLVTREMLSGMKKGAVIVDVAIDQGGCFETSHATTHAEPTYEVDGVIHYCVANMPGAVPVTSAHALNNATLHYGLQLADKGLKALVDDHHLRNGLNVHKGKITNRAVARRSLIRNHASSRLARRPNRRAFCLRLSRDRCGADSNCCGPSACEHRRCQAVRAAPLRARAPLASAQPRRCHKRCGRLRCSRARCSRGWA